ncbi:hypothetical protein DL96DRAFT_1824393 [Flagelloscypha sp. PMI_526]|nr:hypothetical protein DL96DRAFT_1824393 [Flagelloscypha sp. PMI_526]
MASSGNDRLSRQSFELPDEILFEIFQHATSYPGCTLRLLLLARRIHTGLLPELYHTLDTANDMLTAISDGVVAQHHLENSADPSSLSLIRRLKSHGGFGLDLPTNLYTHLSHLALWKSHGLTSLEAREILSHSLQELIVRDERETITILKQLTDRKEPLISSFTMKKFVCIPDISGLFGPHSECLHFRNLTHLLYFYNDALFGNSHSAEVVRDFLGRESFVCMVLAPPPKYAQKFNWHQRIIEQFLDSRVVILTYTNKHPLFTTEKAVFGRSFWNCWGGLWHHVEQAINENPDRKHATLVSSTGAL